MPIATVFSNEMTQLTGNTGGSVQQLPRVSIVTGRERLFVATVPLNGQAAGSVIAVARLPKGAALTGFSVNSTTSLGSSTISLGDTNNATLFAGAITLTAVNTPTRLMNAAQVGVPLDGPNYDCVTGLINYDHEDVVLTVGAAALPVGGTLKIVASYAID